MTQEQYRHPITPPPDLVQELIEDTPLATGAAREVHLITAAYRAGADQELEACTKWIGEHCATWTNGKRPEDELCAARRPKPLSLKQQALVDLEALAADLERNGMAYGAATVRRALKQLSDD